MEYWNDGERETSYRLYGPEAGKRAEARKK